MLQSTQISLLAGHKDFIEIGLRSSLAMAQLACDSADRLGKLQAGAVRSAVNAYGQAARQTLAFQPTGEMAPTIDAMQQTMNYWRRLAGLVAVTQADMADLMQSSSQEVAGWTESRVGKGHQTGAEGLPMAIYTAASASLLASAQTMCDRIGETARQFAANAEIEPESADSDEALATTPARPRTTRKAA
jgi:hypothetical protein